MRWHAKEDSAQSGRGELNPSLIITWETGHFWLLIVYLFIAIDGITPAHLRRAKAALHPGKEDAQGSVWLEDLEVAENGKLQAQCELCDSSVRTTWG